MNYQEKIMKLCKKGYLKTEDVVKEGVPKVYLTNMVKKGILKRVKTGLYMTSETYSDEMFEILTKTKYGIYSSLSSLYLHDKCDRIPIIYDITVPTGYKGFLQKLDNVKLYYVPKNIYDLGLVLKEDMFGNEIRCYDLERTICDIIKYYNKLDKELCNIALRNYFYNKNDESKLYEYAKQMGIYKKLIERIEVLR